eukprot:1387472-Prymnesium_polylepis.1
MLSARRASRESATTFPSSLCVPWSTSCPATRSKPRLRAPRYATDFRTGRICGETWASRRAYRDVASWDASTPLGCMIT